MRRISLIAVCLALQLASAAAPEQAWAATGKTEAPLSANADAQKAYELGEAAYDKDEFDAATAHYSQAIQKDPSFAEAWFSRGWSHRDAGKHDKALADFSEAIRLRPAYAAAFRGRGWSHVGKKDYKAASPTSRRRSASIRRIRAISMGVAMRVSMRAMPTLP